MEAYSLKGEIMRVYNADKTQELTDYDLEKGHLIEDKIVSVHHEKIKGKTVDEQVLELQSQGVKIDTICGKKYKIVEEYSNGGKWVEEIKSIEPIEAYDEYEYIKLYIPYTEEELLDIEKDKLRSWRAKCFEIIDRACWYDCLTDDDKSEVKTFRLALLDITKTMAKPNVPSCVQSELDKE